MTVKKVVHSTQLSLSLVVVNLCSGLVALDCARRDSRANASCGTVILSVGKQPRVSFQILSSNSTGSPKKRSFRLLDISSSTSGQAPENQPQTCIMLMVSFASKVIERESGRVWMIRIQADRTFEESFGNFLTNVEGVFQTNNDILFGDILAIAGDEAMIGCRIQARTRTPYCAFVRTEYVEQKSVLPCSRSDPTEALLHTPVICEPGSSPIGRD